MNHEKDPFAVDLIRRLTETYSGLLWRTERGVDEYTLDTQRCVSCMAVKDSSYSPTHNENCQGVKLIIDALNYVN